jgi:ribosomal protein S18 acetylase RimI-like enzyme
MSAPTPAVAIEQVSTVDDAMVAALAQLIPQLAPASAPPDRARLQAVVTNPASTLLVARDGQGTIVGTLTLVVLPLPTAIRAWIEDVVVDVAARGRGVGESLTREALRLASARGATTIDLTTSPARTAANRLYQRLGFRRRDTNPYRFDPSAGTTDA